MARSGPIGERLNDPSIRVVEGLGELAAAREMTLSQLALLWLKDQPGVTAPIIGPRTPEHLKDALAIVDEALVDDDRPLFDELVGPGTVVSDFHNTARMWMKAVVA